MAVLQKLARQSDFEEAATHEEEGRKSMEGRA